MADTNQEKSDIGVKTVIDYLTGEGFKCRDVAHCGKEHKGYDILAERDGERLRIEVKCSSKRGAYPIVLTPNLMKI